MILAEKDILENFPSLADVFISQSCVEKKLGSSRKLNELQRSCQIRSEGRLVFDERLDTARDVTASITEWKRE